MLFRSNDHLDLGINSCLGCYSNIDLLQPNRSILTYCVAIKINFCVCLSDTDRAFPNTRFTLALCGHLGSKSCCSGSEIFVIYVLQADCSTFHLFLRIRFCRSFCHLHDFKDRSRTSSLLTPKTHHPENIRQRIQYHWTR